MLKQNELPILTGSKSRVSLPLLKWISDPIVFIEPQEEQLYKSKHPNIRFVVMEKNDMGFAYLMNQMCKWVQAQNRTHFIFTDDDVFGLKFRPNMEEKFQTVNDDGARHVLQMAVDQAIREDLSQLAISFSGQSWGAKKPVDQTVGAWGVHVSNAADILSVGGFDESLFIFNDWEISARLIKAGYKNARTNLITFLHKMKSHKGGAEIIYSQPDKVKKAAELLSQRYPGASKVVYVEKHGLHEVRFNWRKLQANQP